MPGNVGGHPEQHPGALEVVPLLDVQPGEHVGVEQHEAVPHLGGHGDPVGHELLVHVEEDVVRVPVRSLY